MDAGIIGIDVSKDRLDVAVRPDGEAFAVSRTGGGIDELIERLKSRAIKLVAIEATGGFETVVAAGLAGAGLPVVVVNPAQVRAFAQALGKRAKTDPIDAAVIAHFAEASKPQLRQLPDEMTRRLADLVAPAPDRRDDRRRRSARQPHQRPSPLSQHCQAGQSLGEGTRRARSVDRRAHARINRLGGEGETAGIRAGQPSPEP
jgi:hypothetical protein